MSKHVSQGLTIIVPTLKEVNNIPVLIERIAKLDLHAWLFEVLIIDDNSQDGTEETVRQLMKSYAWLNILVRREQAGLSRAVLAGIANAKYPYLIIMDADLSHPPEKIPEMLQVLSTQAHVDMVLGSRYMPGGSVDQTWPLPRRFTSWLAAWIANQLLSQRINDPLSGFLAIRKSTTHAGGALDDIGWKIGLEMMLKCPCRVIHEIPIHFAQRQYGKSKLNMKVAFNYLRQIKRLFFYKYR